jgi:Spy/CpxP family protein refolding chaperone
MNSDNSNKWRIRAATLSIFLLGAMAGAFALNAYNLWFGNHQPQTREARFQRLSNELELSQPQTIEVQTIFNETREKMQALRKEDEPKVQEIRGAADEKLKKTLTQDQWDKFAKMRDAKRAEEEKRNK